MSHPEATSLCLCIEVVHTFVALFVVGRQCPVLVPTNLVHSVEPWTEGPTSPGDARSSLIRPLFPNLTTSNLDFPSPGAGGVILFSRNFQDPQQVAELSANLKREAGSRPLLVMVDQEGGRVQRLGGPFTPVPPARTVGSAADVQAAEMSGRILGKELRAVNVDFDLAPVMDVDTNPLNPVIGDRSFGTSAEVVSEMGYAVIRGLQQEGVAACAKHFPGHGDTEQDSHLSLPVVHHPLAR